MHDAFDQIRRLQEQGEDFSYANFSPKGPNGHPIAYGPEYLAWKTRVEALIKRLFGPNSAQLSVVRAANAVSVIGNGSDKFEEQKAYFLYALQQSSAAIAEDAFHELVGVQALAPRTLSNKVFIVHGHDSKAKTELEVLARELGLDPIVLHRQPDEGQTIIEKFEKHSDVGFAFVLLTPDEVAYLASEESMPDTTRSKEYRARPNVIFEFGYFVGRLGRARVCCLYTGKVTLPSDLGGMLYKRFERSVEEVAYSIVKELKALGYELK